MAVPSFLIKNGGEDFMSRQKNIFDVLSLAEKETCLTRTPRQEHHEEVDIAAARNQKRKRTKRFRGKESLFKIPIDPPPKFFKPRPNQLRGKRWIKYSLADVSDYDVSNEGNTAAAFAFLKSLRDREKPCTRNVGCKRDPDDAGEEGENGRDVRKHLFKAGVTQKENEKDKDEVDINMRKAIFRSSKLVMPEYIVGQSKKVKKIVQRNEVSEKGKQVYLDHIYLHEDD